jgi:glycosyltransferase involved in cell wall biosynthesis
MRVLMFGWEYPPYAAGGLATATIALANGVVRLGHSVTLVVPFPAAADGGGVRVVSASDISPNLRKLRVASPLTPYTSPAAAATATTTTTTTTAAAAPWARRAEPSAYRETLFEDVDDYATAARQIAATHPHDVIHVHDWMAYAAGKEARNVSGAPMVAHIHATERDRSGEWRSPEILRRERSGLRDADRVIANSHITKRHVVEEYGVAEHLVDVVHWGIERPVIGDVRLPSPFGANVPIVAFAGRVVMQKGPDYFIEAAAKVVALHPTVCFVVAGTGDMLPRLFDRCIALGISHRVYFTGGLSHEDIDRLYRMATVVVMPSVSEPFGLVALESLRAGTPVIVSKTSGVAEAVANLVTVDFWDVNDIADKMLALITDATLARELRTRTREELGDSHLGPDEPARLTLRSFAAAIAASGVPG